ncbi:hypothetical protein DENSPDRAFT_835009 [Dentipellis sp. KUC8613]|nr:hypothetical protein DENSPDRAFT_835009 [Dentipellis sp. KUC8613]
MTAGIPEDEANWRPAKSLKGTNYFIFDKSIEKSQQDDREYRLIRLENGLQAMIVHDATADKAAASLDVAVGHLNDPDDMPGLAHFCEHLLFMGTEQFPKENEYNEYLSKNNGSSNAYTAASNTNYYFTVATPALTGALARFSGFFHSPLFAPSCTNRELNAVDSENKKNLQSDVWRIFQLNKHLTKPGHPWSKFGTGNKESLTKVGRDLKARQTAANGVDKKARLSAATSIDNSLAPSPLSSRAVSPAPSVNSAVSEIEADGGTVGRETRRRLIEWWTENYCASRMRLCVIGKESLDDLSETVIEFFSPVLNRGKDPLPMITDHPFGPAEKGKLISVQTIMAFHAIEISFPLADQVPLYRYKPANLLSEFIGHEGPGSVHSYLKEKGWITSLNAGPQSLGRGFAMFKVTIHLTKEGFRHYREAALAVFNYLSLLRSTEVPAWYSQEFSKIMETRFRFTEKGRPEDYAVWVSEHMGRPVPRELVLKASQVMSEWDPEGVAEKEMRRALEGLRIFEGRAVLMARKDDHEEVAGRKEWDTEPWYQTAYRVEKFDDDFVQKAEGPNVIPQLHLPNPNNFVPQNLDVDKREVEKVEKRPHLIRQTPSSTLWHKKDDRFWIPRAHALLDIRTPYASSTPEAAVLTRLFVNLVNDALNEYAYAADLAGLNYNLTSFRLGIYVGVGGYNDKLHVLLKTVLERIKSLQVRSDRLEVSREQMKRDWENFLLGQSYTISDYYSRYLMTDSQWTIPELLDALAVVTVQQVQDHATKLLSKIHTLMLVQGNLYKDEAVNIAKMSEEILGGAPMGPYDCTESACFPKESTNLVWSTPVPNPNEPNSALTYYLHLGSYNERPLRVASSLLSQIISEPAFNILRTKEQLGYIVGASLWQSNGSHEIGLRIVVQSERGPVYLEERVEAFLNHMKGVLEAMSDAEFQEQKDGLEKKRREEPKNLSEEVQRFWSQIDSGYLDFYRRSEDADYLKTVTKTDVIALFSKYLLPSSTERKKLSVHVKSQMPRTKHVSSAAMDAFAQHLKDANVALEDVNWREELEGEPTVADFKKYWTGVFTERSIKDTDSLLSVVSGLVEKYPATKDAEGALRSDVKQIEDIKAFKASLRITDPPKPLVEWNDLPVPKF